MSNASILLTAKINLDTFSNMVHSDGKADLSFLTFPNDPEACQSSVPMEI